MDVHIVQKGDTLWKISRQYGISFDELKRVNAHLANPDYIVPGMKIFLPAAAHGKGESKKPGVGHVKEIKKVEKVEKVPPVRKAPAPAEELKVPAKPAPVPTLPKPPKVTSRPVEQPAQTKPEVELPKPAPKPAPKPQPKPEPQLAPEKEAPQPTFTAPPMPPMTQPMQPFPYTVIGIPCGWMPIYDADCYPVLHPGQMQPMPMPAPAPIQPMHQLPVYESPMFQEQKAPKRPHISEEFQKPESPVKKDRKEPCVKQEKKPAEEPCINDFEKQSAPQFAPGPAPELLAPAFEVPAYPAPEPMPYPDYQYQAGYSAPCGCNQVQPMPMHQHHFCNACNQPIGMQNYPMMPYPNPYYWHGMY